MTSSKRRRPWYARRRVLLPFLVVVVLAAVFLLVGSALLRGPVASVLSSAFDREVTIHGLMTLGWSDGPTIAIGKVAIAGQADQPPAVEAGRVDVGLAFDALMQGNLVISQLHLTDVLVRVGALSAMESSPDSATDTPTPTDLSIVSGDLRILFDNITLEAGQDGAEHIAIPHLELTSTAAQGIVIQGRFETGGRNFTVNGSSGPVQTLVSGQDVPVDLVIGDGTTQVEAHGTLAGVLGEPSATIQVSGKGQDLDGLLHAFDVSTGLEGDFALQADLVLASRVLTLKELLARAGEFEAMGDLTFDTAAQRPAISGSLALSMVPAVTAGDEDAQEADAARDLVLILNQSIPYELLETLDLDLVLALGHHDLGPFAIDDITMPVRLIDGHLDVSPIDLSLDGQVLEAHVAVDLEGNNISFRVLGEHMPLTELMTRLRPDLALQGDASGLSFTAEAQGPTVRDLLASLTLDVGLQDLTVTNTFADGTVTTLDIDSLVASAGTNRGLRVNADGRLDDADAAISLAAGPLRDLFDSDEPWPVELHVGNSERGVELAGVLTQPETLKGLNMEGVINARDVQHVAELLDINLPFQGDATAYIHISDLENGVRFDWIDLEVGNSALTGTLDVAYLDDIVAITGSLDAPNLKVDTGEGEENLDAPLLEQGDLDGVHADILLSIDRVKAATVRLRFIDAHLQIDQGVLSIEDAKATVFESVSDVQVRVDASQAQPALSFTFRTGRVDPSHIGGDLGLQGFMTGSIGKIELSAHAQGITLRDLAENADVSLLIEDGALSIGEGETSLEFVSLNLAANPGQPAAGSESILLAGIPIDLDLEFVTLADLFTQPSPWTLKARGALLGFNFSIAREITPALQVYALPVTMEAQSDDLRTALAELDLDLPNPLPLKTRGTLQMLDDRVSFDLAETQLADTDVQGKLEIWLEGERPRVEADFRSGLVTVDDFLETEPITEITDFDIVTFLADPLPVWTMPDVDLKVALDAELINWDGTDLREASLGITTADGAIHLDDLSVRVFAGKVLGSLSVQPVGDATHAVATLDVQEISADDVFRLTGIAEEASGELELLVRADATGATTAALLASLDGTMLLKRGEGWMRSGAIEILNEDLFSALLSSAGRIPVRCTVVDIDFDTGRGTFGESFVALERVVLGIVGRLDLGAMTINAEVIPKSLDGTFMRLLTPVLVDGDLLDPDIGPRTGDLISGLGAALFGAGPTYDGNIDAKCAEAAASG